MIKLSSSSLPAFQDTVVVMKDTVEKSEQKPTCRDEEDQDRHSDSSLTTDETSSLSEVSSLYSSSLGQTRRSIVRRASSIEELHLNEGESCWEALPAPDLTALRASASASLTDDDNSYRPSIEKNHSSSSVSFGDVTIRSYARTVREDAHEHINKLEGPPVQLDWSYNVVNEVTVNAFESKRGPRRSLDQMYLPAARRRIIMSTWQYHAPKDEVEEAKLKRQRSLKSYTSMLPLALPFRNPNRKLGSPKKQNLGKVRKSMASIRLGVHINNQAQESDSDSEFISV